jgi:hypothetical protein
VPWLIATYGFSYAKSIQLDLLNEMLIAIIDENQLMGAGIGRWGIVPFAVENIFDHF